MDIAVVTGAGSGIGRAAAIELSKRGFAVTLIGRRAAPLEETARLCNGQTLALAADVSDAAATARAFETIEQRWGRIDLLFNNAGTNLPTRPIEGFSGSELAGVIASNLISALLCARHGVEIMKRQLPRGGRIINCGSVAAYAPRPNSAAYTAAKHGITGLTKSLLLDGRDHGISCCQIDIGNAATERTLKMTAGVPQANGTTLIEPRLDLDLVATTIADLAQLPAGVSVPFLTIMPTAMPLFGRG